VIGEIGYDSAEYGFDSHTCAVMTTIDDQSPDIAQGVNKGGAGDQGLMFGFACRETPQLMPVPIMIAHAITKRLAYVRRNGIVPYLRPDGKSQVTVEYDGARPVKVDTIVVSSQHAEGRSAVAHSSRHREACDRAGDPEAPASRSPDLSHQSDRLVREGRADGGHRAHRSQDHRDTYGGVGSHGGGAFSGKDPSKVDRSASYGARYVAKNLVASGLCDRAEVQIAYAIGVAEPVSIMVDSNGTG
jgi:S-adenosylmethionine synthetase